MRVLKALTTTAALLVPAATLAQVPAPVSGWEIVSVQDSFTPGYQKVVTALCSKGKYVLGGGYFPGNYQGLLAILGTYPPNNYSWAVYARNTSTVYTPSITVFAVCANAHP